MSQTGHLEFVESPRDPKKVTRTWLVMPVAGGTALGTVRWWTHWRRYTFFPEQARLFDADCLTVIAQFLKEQTAKQQADQWRRRAEKEAGDVDTTHRRDRDPMPD